MEVYFAEDGMSVRTKPLKKKAEISSKSLYTVVRVRDSEDDSWKEVADMISISSSGGGFYLKRPCKVGRLVSLMLPLPVHLRCYDHDKELYRVWGLVQHCHKVSPNEDTGYQVGVAFIGKDPPASYESNPRQTYRICGMNSDGLWKVQEAKSAFKVRKHARFRRHVDHYLALLDGKQRTIGGERTVTQNISKSGAAVYTTLDVGVGERVKFICEQFDFSGLAVVCNRQESESDEPARLHLQFVENTFPVELMNLPEAIIEQA
ncbi:MAG TPA: PilZ domain-containing protein [Pyrinomonadaceae bacterium]|jgi:hypothetical protein|nr:PilZ domain-containing protein [Pyrinomonadaceae bacterium]